MSVFLRFGSIVTACLLLLQGCSSTPSVPELDQGRKFRLKAVSYEDLPEFYEDDFTEALPALTRSCRRPKEKWHSFCRALSKTDASDDEIRDVIQKYLIPYAVVSYGQDTGRITGYYEAELTGTRYKTHKNQVPVYAPPYGYKYGQKLPSREDIEEDDSFDAPIIAWADDPVELFILHVQGSGRMKTPDGEIKLGYAGNNGRPFKGLGQILANEGIPEQYRHSMGDIKRYLQSHPDVARDVMRQNPRYIFFKEQKGDSPIGAAGVVLTPMRSIAVDPKFIPMHTPIWLSTQLPEGQPLNRLVMAQDKGTAIKGPIRADFFFGHGEEAFYTSGRMNKMGKYYLLLPKEESY